MQLQKKSMGDVALIKVSGSIGYMDESTLKSALHRISNEGKHKVVVDCEKMDSLNSNALSTFLRAYKSFKDGRIVFVNANSHVKKILQTTNLDTLFPLYDSVDAALEAMKLE